MKKADAALWRTQRDAKTPFEKEAYRQFIHSTPTPLPTVEDDKNLVDTDSSTVEEKDSKAPKIDKKPLYLQLTDILKNNIIPAIFVGVALFGFIGYLTLWSDSKATQVHVTDNKDQITKLEKRQEDTQKKLNDIDKQLSVFKAEISKDLEFIKQLLPASQARKK